MTMTSTNGSIELPSYLDFPPFRRWLKAAGSDGRDEDARTRIAAWTEMVDKHDVVRTWVDGRVGWIEISYPIKGNAYIPPLYGKLIAALIEHRDNEEVRCIALTGAGKNFSSGGYVGDHAFFAGLDSGEDGTRTEPMRRTFVELFQEPNRLMYECEKPTVAVINGLVAGEAIDLVLSADIRVASTAADLWFSAAYSGNTGYSGSAWLLPKIVGAATAKRLMFTAARIGAQEALDKGVVTDVFEPEQLRAKAQELCTAIASLPPITLRLIKQELHKSYEIPAYGTAMDVYAAIETIVQTTDDHMNAEIAIAKKEVPPVTGR
jgi:enoyl-CoA hydratase/carnithine racemase